jgi:hypothetical protein
VPVTLGAITITRAFLVAVLEIRFEHGNDVAPACEFHAMMRVMKRP